MMTGLRDIDYETAFEAIPGPGNAFAPARSKGVAKMTGMPQVDADGPIWNSFQDSLRWQPEQMPLQYLAVLARARSDPGNSRQ